MRQRMLVSAVIIHRPDFFVPSATTDEINLAFRNTGDPAAQPEDDFIREFMRRDAGGINGGGIRVLLPEHLWRGDVLHVIKPALHSHAVAADAEISKRQHGCIWRRGTPGIEFHIRWRADRP